MKTLLEYIHEAAEEKSVPASKTITFNFNGCEGVEDFLKSVQEIGGEDLVEIEDEKVKVHLKKDSLDNAEGLYELMQDYINARRNDEAAHREEAYAEKTRKLEELLGEWRDYVDDADEDDSADDSKEDSKEDEKCPKCGKNPCECDKKEEE
ncbi:MAG: hypothetical protein IJH39_05875 [Clostridia bacterium]|nr:hypothetical protein [Clostridia bacterium]